MNHAHPDATVPHEHPPAAAAGNPFILRFRDVTVRYGPHVALDGVTASIPCNSLTAVVGPNGAGKTTLLRATLGWLPLARGEIRIGDSHAHHALPRLAYLPQRPEVDWDFPITVESVVAQGRYPALGPFRRFRAADAEMVERALEEMGLAGVRDRQIRCLSGGQQQKVFLARALAQGADIFLLDEPFAGLDARATDDLVARLARWQDQGRTVLVVVHDLELARRAFPQTVLLNSRLVAAGTTTEVLAPAHVAAAYKPAAGGRIP
jgi:manganese/zinc/iron transport system ATP- binding protein